MRPVRAGEVGVAREFVHALVADDDARAGGDGVTHVRSASGSCNGRDAPAGLNGHVCAPGPLLGRATFVAIRVGTGLAGATRIVESGITRATAGLCRRSLTSAADSVAATELGAVSWSTLVPWLARMLETMEAWSARESARSWLSCARRLSPGCWFFSTTMTAPPLAAPASAGAMGEGAAAARAGRNPVPAKVPRAVPAAMPLLNQ